MRSNPQRLREIREDRGHTMNSLARDSGVSVSRISELEANAVSIRPTTAKKLAAALDVSMDAFTTKDRTPAVAS